MSGPLPLELQIALDLVAPELNRVGGPALVCGPEAAAEWLDGARTTPLPLGEDGRSPGEGVARGGAGTPSPYPLPLGEESLGRVLAIDPTVSELRGLALALAPGGVLGVVCAGGLAPLFTRLRGKPRRAVPFATARGVLAAAGLTSGPAFGIGRPDSPLLALLARAAVRADRPDVADRLEVRYRRSLAPHRRPAMADLAAFVARRS